MKVLIADKFEDSGRVGLQALGCEIVYNPDLKDDTLTATIRESGAEVLVVRSTKVTAPMIEAGRLSLIVRAGAGYNTIDVKAASAAGIYVSNCPGKNSIAVAELAFALIAALDRRIADNVAQLREGVWNKKEFGKARGLYGQTLGLIGLGQIGQEMIPRAKAFGMPVVAWSRSLTPERAHSLGVEFKSSPADVAASCDILSVHLALSAETRGVINAQVLGAMRPGSCFINTSRGEVVDEVALAETIQQKGLRAGLDVFAQEPSGATGEFTDSIVKLSGVYGTHHIGASTDQAQEAIAAETVRIIKTFKDTGSVPNVVNLCRRSPATHLLVVRHRDRPGVLAHVLDHLKAVDINVQEMTNVVFDGAEAAIARIHLDQAPPTETIEQISNGNKDILELTTIGLNA